MIKIEKNKHSIKIVVDGAGFAIPIEVIKAIKKGEMEDTRYRLAAEFLSGESGVGVTFKEVKELYEASI